VDNDNTKCIIVVHPEARAMRIISCKKCGAEVSDQYSFCTNCGAPLRDDASPVRDSQKGEAEIPVRPYTLESHPQPTPPSRTRQVVYVGSFFSLLKQSLTAYKNNLLLLVPVIVSIITTIVTSYVTTSALLLASSFSSAKTLEEQTSILHELFGVLPYFVAFGLVSFLVSLGLMTMIGQIVTGNKCKLSDWVRGIRAFFWRIFKVSIVINLLFGLVSGAITPMILGTIRILAISVEGLVSALSTLILYLCCAAIIVDNAGLQASINLAIKTIRRAGRDFLILFVLYFLFFYSRTILWTPNLFASGLSRFSNLSYLANITNPQGIAFTILWSLLVPVWLLVIFMLYCRQIPPK
jgi:hypothetical protein